MRSLLILCLIPLLLSPLTGCRDMAEEQALVEHAPNAYYWHDVTFTVTKAAEQIAKGSDICRVVLVDEGGAPFSALVSSSCDIKVNDKVKLARVDYCGSALNLGRDQVFVVTEIIRTASIN